MQRLKKEQRGGSCLVAQVHGQGQWQRPSQKRACELHTAPRTPAPQKACSFPNPTSLLETLAMPRAISQGPVWQMWLCIH